MVFTKSVYEKLGQREGGGTRKLEMVRFSFAFRILTNITQRKGDN